MHKLECPVLSKGDVVSLEKNSMRCNAPGACYAINVYNVFVMECIYILQGGEVNVKVDLLSSLLNGRPGQDFQGKAWFQGLCRSDIV